MDRESNRSESERDDERRYSTRIFGVDVTVAPLSSDFSEIQFMDTLNRPMGVPDASNSSGFNFSGPSNVSRTPLVFHRPTHIGYYPARVQAAGSPGTVPVFPQNVHPRYPNSSPMVPHQMTNLELIEAGNNLAFRRSLRLSRGTVMESLSPPPPPLDHGLSEEDIVRCLETSTIREIDSQELEDHCTICIVKFAAGDEIGKINCVHKYHYMCIKEWLKRKNVCPICRAIALNIN